MNLIISIAILVAWTVDMWIGTRNLPPEADPSLKEEGYK